MFTMSKKSIKNNDVLHRPRQTQRQSIHLLNSTTIISLLYGLTLAVFLGIWLQNYIPVKHLTHDPMAIVDESFYFGAISQIGILIWCTAGSACLLGLIILKRLNTHGQEFSNFFMASFWLTTLLMLDDLFMVHDKVFPIHLGIDEKIVYAVYAIAVLLYLFRFRKKILKTNFRMLVLAFVFFGLSIGIDLINFDKTALPEDWINRDIGYLARRWSQISWSS